MKMSKKLIALLLALLMVFSMVACGAKEEAPVAEEEAKTETPKEEVKEEAKEETKEEAPEAEEEDVTIRFAFLNEWANAQGVAIQEKLADFNKEYPNIHVELDMIPVSDYQTKILTDHATGANQYDMFFVDNSWTGTMAQAGAVADLSDLVTEYGIAIDDYFPGFLETCKIDGKLYAIPFETDCRMLAYNKQMFEDAGIAPPTTTEEFLAAAEALTTDDTYGFVCYMVGTGGECMINELGSLLFQGNGGSFVEKDGDEYKANFDTEAGVTYLENLRRLAACMPKDIVNYDYSMYNSAFATGKAAMAVYGPWIYTEAAILESGLDYGLTLIPAGDKTSFSAQGGWLMGVSANSKNMDATMKFVSFLCRPEISADVVGALSPMGAAYQYGNMTDPKYVAFAEQLETAAPAIISGIPGRTALAQDAFDQIVRAILTDDDVNDIAKDVNAAIQNAIDSAQ